MFGNPNFRLIFKAAVGENAKRELAKNHKLIILEKFHYIKGFRDRDYQNGHTISNAVLTEHRVN